MLMGGLLLSCSVKNENLKTDTDYVSRVNTLIGSDSKFSLSNGNTYPALALPWGMNFWTPQTGTMGNGWIYAYDADKINGFKQTHQASNWLKDYGCFSLMPLTGSLKTREEERASWFSHKAETAKPHYYSVYLADYDLTTEITPTERAACFRFTFPDSDSSYIILDGFNKGSEVKIIPEERKIIGYSRFNSGSVPENFHNFFVAVFDKDFSATYTWKGDQEALKGLYNKGDHVGAVVGFKTEQGEQVHVKVASSFISPEQAEINLEREIGNKNFETIKDEAGARWNAELSRIKVEGGSEARLNTFYSCLYRVLLFPRKFYEFDAQNNMIHYSPYNGKVLPGFMFTDNGFWDTFRAEFPFLTLLYPGLNSDIMKGLVNAYKESGWLPEWATPGHRNCMIGSNSASIIADSYLKGIRDYDIDLLYEALIKNTKGPNPLVASVGRLGASYYNELGYIPYDVGIKENAARTLEYAYADFCLAELAKALDRPEKEVKLFERRSRNYANLFDPEHKLMRGKNADGSFQSPFNPLKWGDAFTEGNSLHYTWSVFHDVQGLIDLMGGKKIFVSMLDTVFSMPPDFDCSYYGFPIHEIREMQIANMGNYAHGNQPIQHMIYLYNYAAQPWKAQQHVREVMDKLYLDTPDGYCGDEDNGQTSAWYVFSSMGFYPVCPGSGQYVMGSPLFKKITLELENGRSFEIDAPDNAPDKPYIQKALLNGKAFEQNWLSHEAITEGGKLFLEMSKAPNKKRGTSEEDKPFSMSGQARSAPKTKAAAVVNGEKEAVDFVNPYMGNISHLLVPTFPTIHLPNSMLRVIPGRWDYTTDKLRGLPVVTTSHRGSSAFTISPVCSKTKLEPVYHYSYDHEKLSPYSWEVFLDDEGIDVSFGLSHQSGIYTIDFENEGSRVLLINNNNGQIKVENNTITGFQIVSNAITSTTTRVYLYFETKQNPVESGILKSGEISNLNETKGENGCVALRFADKAERIDLKYGISFISVEQAKLNLYREIPDYNRKAVTEAGRDIWNKVLNKTLVTGGSEDDKTVFYTSIYRTYERPVCISEDGKYYSAFDGLVHDDEGSPFYTDDWIWDTYRATHPLRCLTEKEMELDILRSFLRMAEQMEQFWMPTFPEITGDSRRMNSNHGVATVLDAYTKGLTDFDLEKAYLACKNAITQKTLAPWSGKKAGELDEFYKEHGYFPALKEGEKETVPEVHPFESRQPVAVTLGTVYDEWCLSQIARILGNEDDHRYFLKRAFNYRELYNPETGFFHPKDEQGKFIMPFDYRYSGGMGARKYYGENNGWTYRWDVPHSIADLIDLMGGPEKFIENLEATFNEPLGKSKYAFYAQLPDHTGNVGQFSMANEPSLHIPYLYNYAGQAWKTQKRIRKILHEWFRNDLMGLPGDEDGGGMSAFVAFSQMGFYPVTPGSASYNIGSPVFEKSTIDLGNGNTFTIRAKNVSFENKYIQSASLNGTNWNKPWFGHEQIQNGGELILTMGPKANKEWGSAGNSAPPSAVPE